MNINQLHNKLVKKANMKKVAGPAANKLRNIIAELNNVRGNKNILGQLDHLMGPDLMRSNFFRSLERPFRVKNEHLKADYDILQLKSKYLSDDDLNRLIDRVSKNINAREKKLREASGNWNAAEELNQNLINKYIKDIY